MAAAPVISWPFHVVNDDGRRLDLAAALGGGGDRVERLLSHLVTPAPRPSPSRLAALAADTPSGRCDLPVKVVPLAEAAEAAGGLPEDWLAVVAERRSAPRRLLVDAGRAEQLEAGLHVAMLLGVEHLAAIDRGVDVRAASGAQLWLLGGMVTGALADASHDHFAPWAELLGCGLWPIGPVAGALVTGDARL